MKRQHCHAVIKSFPAMLLALAIGCGGQSGDHVSGTVTFDGKPVPAGKIYFMPDQSKGNSGSTGFANIVDGRYDSRLEGGRPIGSGPMILTIEGMDPSGTGGASEPDSEEVTATLLFAGYKMETDIAPGATTLDIDVPASAAGVPESKSEGQFIVP